jgi:hypothetical protein
VLGQGGPFGDPASAILSRGRGSRAVLLKSLLDVLGAAASATSGSSERCG